MILADFRSLVLAMTSRDGQAYISQSDLSSQTQIIQEQLDVYAAFTGCIFVQNVSFTPTIGVGSYYTYTPFGVPLTFLAANMSYVDQIAINGVQLTMAGDPMGRMGPSVFEVFLRENPTYLTAGNGKPTAWFQESYRPLIVFSCPFDQIYANCFFTGRLYHSPLNTTNGGENQNLDLLPDDVRIAAQLVRNELLRPYNAEMADALDGPVYKKMILRAKACGMPFSEEPKDVAKVIQSLGVK